MWKSPCTPLLRFPGRGRGWRWGCWVRAGLTLRCGLAARLSSSVSRAVTAPARAGGGVGRCEHLEQALPPGGLPCDCHCPTQEWEGLASGGAGGGEQQTLREASGTCPRGGVRGGPPTTCLHH